MNLPDNAVVFVEHAEHLGDFRIRLGFSDGYCRVIDFAPFLCQSRNPLIQTYLDPVAFTRFTIKDGDLVWGDYDLCFPVADLYEGRV